MLEFGSEAPEVGWGGWRVWFSGVEGACAVGKAHRQGVLVSGNGSHRTLNQRFSAQETGRGGKIKGIPDRMDTMGPAHNTM